MPVGRKRGRHSTWQRAWGRGYGRRGRQGRFPARNDFPDRRTEYDIRPVFHRQQLPRPDFARAGIDLQCHVRTPLPEHWHIHRATNGGGQMLIGVAGRGWYQEEGKPAVEILPGTVIHIPANVKHWHGAAADSWFAHLAFEVPGENASTSGSNPLRTKNTVNSTSDKRFAGEGLTALRHRMSEMNTGIPKTDSRNRSYYGSSFVATGRFCNRKHNP